MWHNISRWTIHPLSLHMGKWCSSHDHVDSAFITHSIQKGQRGRPAACYQFSHGCLKCSLIPSIESPFFLSLFDI